MATPLALRLATHLLVYDGLVALVLGGLIGLPAAALVAAAVTASWWRDRLVARLPLLERAGPALVVVAAAASAIDVAYVAASMLIAMVRFLLFLLVYSLFVRRGAGHAGDVWLLSLFMLVAAAPVTSGVGFLFVFLGFVAAGTWALMLQHVVSEAAGEPAGGVGRLAVAAIALTLVVTAAFFFAIPRVGRAAFLGAQAGRMVSGFSERVQLGAFGEIEADTAVVMRVHVEDGLPGPEWLGAFRWRGIAFDHFDGRVWTVGPARRVATLRSASGDFELSAFRGPGPLVVQEVFLEPIASEVVFGAPRMVRIALRTDTVTLDDLKTVSVPAAPARLHYRVYSQLDATGRPGAEPDAALEAGDPAARRRYLQLPRLSERIGRLAREITADTTGPAEAADRLTAFFAGFRYTTILERGPGLEPLEDFLFVSRSGNCEYFAAALTVMLRAVGIPARLVNGFQRGEWNGPGRFFVVRMRDAHSWVEAYLPERGWVTLDPSPRGEPAADGGRWSGSAYLDVLRLRWYRYVVSWDLRDQLTVAVAVHRATAGVRPGAPARRWADPAALLAVAALVLAAGLAIGVWRRRGRPAPAPGSTRLPRFYARALRALRRRGLRPESGETAREFSARVARAAPECAAALTRLTAAYEQTRFGARPPAAAEMAELERATRGLGKAAAAR